MGMSPTERRFAENGSEIWVYKHKLISQIIGFKVAILCLVLLEKSRNERTMSVDRKVKKLEFSNRS